MLVLQELASCLQLVALCHINEQNICVCVCAYIYIYIACVYIHKHTHKHKHKYILHVTGVKYRI